jgi:hypothetical protein
LPNHVRRTPNRIEDAIMAAIPGLQLHEDRLFEHEKPFKPSAA